MLLLLALALTEFISVVGLFVANIWHYKWLLGGAAAYLLIRKIGLFARNEQWLQTTSHESTHALVGMLFLHKIHSLQAGDGSGVVYHSGGRFGSLFISLAPTVLLPRLSPSFSNTIGNILRIGGKRYPTRLF